MKIIRLLRFRIGLLLFIFLSGIFIIGADIATLKEKIDEKQSAYQSQLTRLNALKSQAAYIEGEIRAAAAVVEERQKDTDKKWSELESIQKIIRQRPDISSEKERLAYNEALEALRESEKALSMLKNRLHHVNKEVKAKEAGIEGLQKEISVLKSRLADRRFESLQSRIEEVKTVVAVGEAGCNDLISECKTAALEAAKRNAAEQGAANLVESLTEVKDGIVEKDEIRSRIKAIILDYKVLEKKFIGESAFRYKIEARVQGQVPSDASSFKNRVFGSDIPAQPSAVRLFVETAPSDAVVRILNIKPRFRQGILLEPGPYQIEAAAEGYETYREWIEITAGEDKTVFIKLVKKDDDPPPRVKNDLGMEFAYIPSGTFWMGSPENEKGRYDSETRHQVTISKGFYMQTTEVTQGQWKEVMGNNPSYFKNCGDDCPVERVSWNDIQEYIKKLNRRVEGTYRLPTEAEWEYAARAGTETPFYTGDCLSTDEANYDGNYPYEGCSKGVYRGKTMPVGSFSANAWGLYDMHGNVWEWCADWYGGYPSGSVTDPTGPATGGHRVLRGGSWYNHARNCRSANRDGFRPGDRGDDYGFRLVFSPPGHPVR